MSNLNDDDWVCIRVSLSHRAISELQLVLTSVGIESKISRSIYGWKLYTYESWVSVAEHQLKIYRKENQPLAEPTPIPVIDKGWWGVIGYLLVIWGVPALDQLGVFSDALQYQGVMAVEFVNAGEWWRTITALTLHADIGHLLANTFSGIFIGMICGRYFGSGFAWFLIVFCGAIGNELNASVQPDTFRSVGASTALFGGAGLAIGIAWRRNFVQGGSARLNYLPLASAVALFAFVGIGGENTDIFAHLTGLATGLAVGTAIASFDARRLGISGQWILGILTIITVFFAWNLAIL